MTDKDVPLQPDARPSLALCTWSPQAVVSHQGGADIKPLDKQHLCTSTALPCRMSPMHATPHCHAACLLYLGCAAGSCHSTPHLPAQLACSPQLMTELGGQCVPAHKHSHTRLWLCLKHAWVVLLISQFIAGHTQACYVMYSAVKLGRMRLTQLFSML